MRTGRSVMALVLAAAMVVSAGCGRDAALSRQADRTYERLLASAAEAQKAPAVSHPATVGAVGEGGERLIIFAAPLEPDAPAMAGAVGVEAADVGAAFESIEGRPFGEILKRDLKEAPRSIGRGFIHSYANPENLIILGVAFGADRIVRHNLDGQIRGDLRDNDTSLAETGDFGSVIGNPALHFGIAGAWYLAAVRGENAQHHEMSKTLMEALAVNGLSTMALKLSMGDESPNGEKWGWPSGHTSSSVCFASVLHEFYGWEAGLPLYLLAGYSAASRLEDREHDLSDIVFGAALGWVVGHSVAKGELPQVAGFHILPYGGPDTGGLMFVKSW
ncbi:MAG: phosphatase PAP2 family protein [Phycisphaerae bacterium]